MAILKITQTKSRIGATERQGRNLDALGLHRMNRTAYHEDSPIIMGMLDKVRHLVTVETVNERPKKEAAPKKAAPAVKKEAVKEDAPKAEPKAKETAPEKKAAAPKKPAAPKAAPAKKEAAPKAPAKPKAAPAAKKAEEKE